LTEGVDYFIHLVDFPNCASPICVTPNDDGTFSVYANARYTIEQIKRSLPHEIVHMIYNHFGDDRQIEEIEAEADEYGKE